MSNIETKTIQASTFRSIVEQLLEAGKEGWVLNSGNSAYPIGVSVFRCMLVRNVAQSTSASAEASTQQPTEQKEQGKSVKVSQSPKQSKAKGESNEG